MPMTIFRGLRGTLFAGVVWFLVLLHGNAALLAWCAPLLFGLALALPVAILSSRTTLGDLARRLGLFLTPEEVAPASILRAYGRAMAGSLPAERPHPTLAGLQLAPSSAEMD